jgi:hypothetical protein
MSEKAQEGADQAQQGTEPEKGNSSKKQQEGSNVEHAV